MWLNIYVNDQNGILGDHFKLFPYITLQSTYLVGTIPFSSGFFFFFFWLFQKRRRAALHSPHCFTLRRFFTLGVLKLKICQLFREMLSDWLPVGSQQPPAPPTSVLRSELKTDTQQAQGLYVSDTPEVLTLFLQFFPKMFSPCLLSCTSSNAPRRYLRNRALLGLLQAA